MLYHGFSKNITKYCVEHWRDRTCDTYKYKIRSWIQFNSLKKYNALEIDPVKLLEYLIHLFEVENKSLTNIRNHIHCLKSLCSAIGKPITTAHARQFDMTFHSMFLKKPSKLPAPPGPIWDVKLLLDHFERQQSNKHLTLMALSKKLATLLLLISMHRSVDLTGLHIRHLTWEDQDSTAIFKLQTFNKTYTYRTTKRMAMRLQTLRISLFMPANDSRWSSKVCPVRCLHHYLRCTKLTWGKNSQLFVTTTDSFMPAKLPTIYRWVKVLMHDAGIDISKYAPGSIRKASSSSAFAEGISVQTILKRAGWTNSNTFAKHYL